MFCYLQYSKLALQSQLFHSYLLGDSLPVFCTNFGLIFCPKCGWCRQCLHRKIKCEKLYTLHSFTICIFMLFMAFIQFFLLFFPFYGSIIKTTNSSLFSFSYLSFLCEKAPIGLVNHIGVFSCNKKPAVQSDSRFLLSLIQRIEQNHEHTGNGHADNSNYIQESVTSDPVFSAAL